MAERPQINSGYLLAQRLRPFERLHVRWMNFLLGSPRLDRMLRWCHWHLGAPWINLVSRGRLHAIGLERFPDLDPGRGYVLAANHLSYFDLFVVLSFLARARRIQHRILFPVRSAFFYDNPLGILVNGLMSFFAMYPPIFRDRARLGVNLAALDEMVKLVSTRDVLLGIHPEGTRNKTGDPYTLLPAQSGVGRIVHRARCPVLPVFLHGPGNSLLGEMRGTLTGTGKPIILVFGEPVPMDDLLERRGTASVYGEITARTMAAISALGQEERQARARLEEPADA